MECKFLLAPTDKARFFEDYYLQEDYHFEFIQSKAIWFKLK